MALVGISMVFLLSFMCMEVVMMMLLRFEIMILIKFMSVWVVGN